MDRIVALVVEAGNVRDLLQDSGVRVKKGYSLVSRPTGETGKVLQGVPLVLLQDTQGHVPITASLLTER